MKSWIFSVIPCPPSNSAFTQQRYKLLPEGEFDTGFRIVRIHLESGNYICIAANLSEE